MSDSRSASKRRAVIIGIENGCVPVVRELLKRRKLPNLSRVIDQGVFGEATACMNLGPNMNWMSIATGAFPGTTGVSCLSTHRPGDSLFEFRSGFFSDACKAEFLWNAAERAGRKSILIRYPGSWPPTIKNGAQVGGYGHFCSIFEMAKAARFSTEDLPPQYGGLVRDVHIDIESATNWANLPKTDPKPLATTVDIIPEWVDTGYDAKFPGLNIVKPSFKRHEGKPAQFHVLITGATGAGKPAYDTVHICREKDYATRVASLRCGEWSEWIETEFEIDVPNNHGMHRFKVLELSLDASKFSLFVSDTYPNSGWSYPDALAEELVRNVGPFQELHRMRMMRNPKIGKENLLYCWSWGEQLYLDEIQYQGRWLGEAAAYLMKRNDWDLLFLCYPNAEVSQHVLLPQVDPACPVYDPSKAEKAWDILAAEYSCADAMIGKVLSQCDRNTVVAVVSQHGMVSAFKCVNVQNALARAGLLGFNVDAATKQVVVDWSRTKATTQRELYVYVNLKGREPHGIVEPGAEYERVRDQGIDVLYSLRDPETGVSPIAMALKKEDAAAYGLYGDDVGDVVYAFRPPYYGRTSMGWGEGGEPSPDLEVMMGTTASLGAHGQLLPTARFGIGSMAAMFIMAGPGVKKGACPLPVRVVDIAPTIAHLLDIPTPKHAEGRVLHEILE